MMGTVKNSGTGLPKRRSWSLMGKLLVAMLVMAIAAGSGFSLLSTSLKAEGDSTPVEVTSWTQLKEELANGKTNFILMNNVIASEQLEITKSVTISANDSACIFRHAGNANFSVFKVTGTLTLGNGVSMSGGTIVDDTLGGNDDITPPTIVETTTESVSKETTSQTTTQETTTKETTQSTKPTTQETTTGTTQSDGTTYTYYRDPVETKEPFDNNLDDTGFLFAIDGPEQGRYVEGNVIHLGYKQYSIVAENDKAKFYVGGSHPATAIWIARAPENSTDSFYNLYSISAGKYLCVEENGYAALCTKEQLKSYGNRALFSMIKTNDKLMLVDKNGNGLGMDMQGSTDPNNFKPTFTKANETPVTWALKYKTIKSDKPLNFTNKSRMLSAPLASPLANSQTPTDVIYTLSGEGDGKEKFTGENGKGFFVTVEGGTFNMESGSKLTGLVIGETEQPNNCPKDVAPVYVEGGSFNLKEGAEIYKNTVGYMANEEKSGMHIRVTQGSNDIYHYLRETDFTFTAGAVIFNGGSGTLEGVISSNKGDTGAVMLKNKAVVSMSSGTIKNNVGFHYSGGVTVADGASLTMNGGTMSGNVAWAKGGAVWATEFGTKGYARYFAEWRLFNRDSNGGGSFIMNNGTLTGNTAFSRGGAINVESNGVKLIGGSLTNNNCRGLGGAVYVEGDKPEEGYSYTLYIAKAYIGNNKAVRPDYIRAEDSLGTITNTTLAELNQILDRRLGSPADDGTPIHSGSPTTSVVDKHGVSGNVGSTADLKDFWSGYQGNGGGVWLCPFGVTVFNMGEGEVVIDENQASGAFGDMANHMNRLGTDFFLLDGQKSEVIFAQSTDNWIDESTNEQIATNNAVY
ncbi:MAG: hypothetical protein IJR47_01725, partial [Clostridia bacterium]|nr:hypothetical protein [Clostridia bacterium]